MAEILDSGERTVYSTGAVRDLAGEDKGSCELLPLDIVASLMDDSVIAAVYAFQETGETKYLIDALKSFRGFESLSDMMLEVSLHYRDGAKKYGRHNWQKGIDISSYVNSMIRHYLKFKRGDDDERHDRAFVWNVLSCCWTMIHKPEMDDFTEKNRNYLKGENNV